MVALVHPIDVLYAKLGDRVKENVSLAPYTSARIGGPADTLVTVRSADELSTGDILVTRFDQGEAALPADRCRRTRTATGPDSGYP